MVKLRMRGRLLCFAGPSPAVLVATLAVVLLAASPASAQRTTAELRGTVTDTTGGVLPGAVVAVEGPTERRDTVTDGAGFYRVSYLPAGPYTVTVSLDGFQPAELQVTVALDRTLTANARLNVGQAERLVVRPDEWALDISRSSLSSVVSPDVIDMMPVNNRNYLDLIRLTPGVVNNAGAGAAAPSSLDTSGAILGERAGNASFLLDGLWNNNAFGGGVLQNLTQDTVEQFEVVATGYAAEFGQGSGGVVNVITKSGANTMSGSGFSFIRNDAMDAANVDGEDAPDLTRYNVDFTVGGPICEDRDWFFGSLEFVSEDRQSLFPQDIPPALAAQEDFSRQPELRDNRLFGKYTRDLGFGDRLHAFASWEQLDQRNQLGGGSGALPSSGQDTDDTSFLTGATLISPLSDSTVFEAQLGVRGQSFDGRGSLGESRSFSAIFLVPRSEKHLVFFPAFDELGVAMPVAPRDVRQDRPAAVLMIRIVGVGQREIADAREDRFDPIQPRGVGRREDELHVVVGGPVGHLASLVRREVVEHEVEARGDRVARANVREEQQHFAIALAPVAAHHEPIGFDVVGREVLARAMEPPIRRAQPRRVPDLAPRAPMIRAHFDGPELVETDHPAVRRCRPVERTDAFFWRRSPDRGSPSRSSCVGTRSPGRAGCGRAWWHAAP